MFYKEQKSHELLTGMLIGATVGAVAGMLLAPKAGQDTARDLLEGTGNFLKQAKSHLNLECNDENSPFCLGNIIGAVLSGSSKIILAPKSSKIVREYISDSYQNISDRTWELINNLNVKGETISELVKNQASDWTEKSLEVAEKITEEVREWSEALRDAALEAKQKAEHLGQDPAYKNKITEVLNWSQKAFETADDVIQEVRYWRDSIQSALHNFNQKKTEFNFTKNGSQKYSNFSGNSEDNMAQIMDWAKIGYNIWQNLQNKKR